MTDFDRIDYEVSDGAAIVTIERPDTLNALDERAMDEIAECLVAAERTDQVRVAVIRGTEKAFSSGYDLGGDGGEMTELTVADWLDRMRSYPLLPQIYELDIPVIAAVDGYALGGGCNLALICDLTFVTQRAKLGYSDVRMGGLPAHFIHPFVTGSLKHARELYYSGKMISGAEAARMGMVNRAVPHEALMDEVWAEIEEIKKTPGVVVSMTKGMLNDVMERQGFRPRGRSSEVHAALSVQSDQAEEFYSIRDEEGLEVAIEWMHNDEKP